MILILLIEKKITICNCKNSYFKKYLIYSKGTKRITDKSSDKLTHYLRYKNDAIMISSKTLILIILN